MSDAARAADSKTFTLDQAVPTLIARFASTRRALLVMQHGTTSDVWLDFNQGVTAHRCILLPAIKGAAIVMRYTGEVWAIAETNNPVICVAELSQ